MGMYGLRDNDPMNGDITTRCMSRYKSVKIRNLNTHVLLIRESVSEQVSLVLLLE